MVMVVNIVKRIPYRFFFFLVLHNNTFWYYYSFQYQILQENVTGIKNGDHNADNDTKCDSEENDSKKEESDSDQIEEIDLDDD